MDIEAFISSQAPSKDMHDNAYAKALREAHSIYKGMDLKSLEEWQGIARKRYDSSHHSTAACVILLKLIEGKNV